MRAVVWFGFDDNALVSRGLAPEHLGPAFDGLGVDPEAGEFEQRFGALGEADPSGGDVDRAQRPRCQCAFVEAEGTRRSEAMPPTDAVPLTLTTNLG